MITDRRGRKRRFIYEPQGRFATPADIPTEISQAHPLLDADLAPGECALRRGKIVVREIHSSDHCDLTEDPASMLGRHDNGMSMRFFTWLSVTLAARYRQGMVAATKLRRAR